MAASGNLDDRDLMVVFFSGDGSGRCLRTALPELQTTKRWHALGSAEQLTVANGSAGHGPKRASVNFACCPSLTSTGTK
jgi:hypothetical protein